MLLYSVRMMLRSLTCLNRLVDVLDHGFVQFRTSYQILTDANGGPIMAEFRMYDEADLPEENGLFLNLIWENGSNKYEQRVFVALKAAKFPKEKSNIMEMLLPANVEYFKKAILGFYKYKIADISQLNLEGYEFEERKNLTEPRSTDLVFYVLAMDRLRKKKNRAMGNASLIPTPVGPVDDSIELSDDEDNVESPTNFVNQCKVVENASSNIQCNGFFFTIAWKRKGNTTAEARQAVFLCCAVDEIDELSKFIAVYATGHGDEFKKVFVGHVATLDPSKVNDFDISVRISDDTINKKTNTPYGGKYLFYIL